jgi:hypothetical protein
MIPVINDEHKPWEYLTTKLKNHAKAARSIEYNAVSGEASYWKMNPGTVFVRGIVGEYMIIQHKRRPNVFQPGDYHHSMVICSVLNPSRQEEVQLSWLMIEKYKIVGQVKNIESYVTLKSK